MIDATVLIELYKPISDDAIQRTDGKETKRGYDTSGYGYQWCVDRFNDTLAEKWGYNFKVLREAEGQFANGKPCYDVTVEVSIWIDKDIAARSCIGGHLSGSYADALKGAITNGFKKTAAFWGVGAAAYRGEIDDDNASQPETITVKPIVYKQNPPSKNQKTIDERRLDALKYLAENAKHLGLGKEELFKQAIDACKDHADFSVLAVEMKTSVEHDSQEALF